MFSLMEKLNRTSTDEISLEYLEALLRLSLSRYDPILISPKGESDSDFGKGKGSGYFENPMQ